MSEKLLKNLIMLQENLEDLDTGLFDSFMSELINLYDFLAKENDPLFMKKQTIEKLKENPDYLKTLRTINRINQLEINRDTRFNLLKYLFEKNSPGKDNQIYMFSMYMIWSNNIKLLKKQQKELLTILKKDNGKNFLKNGGLVLLFLMDLNIITEKTFFHNMKEFQFEVFHELNKGQKINFNTMNETDFIQYLLHQFKKYNLRNSILLSKSNISLKESVIPFFEQNLNQNKKDILSLFLNLIRDKLDLDTENSQFLDKLILNSKLSQITTSIKIKKIKI